MTIIAGTTIDWTLSPRVVTIPVAETSITVEDLQDTLLDLEDDEEGIVWPFTRSTTGGESLGGGVTVGLTMELQNTQVAFAPRTTVTSSGSATTANATGTVLIDSAATFIADGVAKGATVVNITDQSVSSVLSIDSEIQLTHYPLLDGTDDDWDGSDVYKVWNEIQCEVTGGNLVAVDNLDAEMSSVFPTFGTQVLKTSASSATTSNQTALEHSVFNDRVILDPTDESGLAATGTDYPAGTSLQPSLNITDATTIAVVRGFNRIQARGSVTLDNTVSLDNYNIIGDTRAATVITFSTADTGNLSLENVHFTGSMSGGISADNCAIGTVTGLGCTVDETIITNTIIDGNITLRSDNSQPITLVNCGSADNNQMTLDVNGTTGNISIQNYTDRIKIINMTSAINLHVSSAAGCELTIDATCTAVTLLEVHGNINIINNSGLTVDNDTTQALVWEHIIDGTFTAEEVTRLIASALAAKASGLDTNNPIFRDLDDTKDRITAVTDSDGNRTSVTHDAT